MTVKSHIDDMQRHNVIRESASSYADPVVMNTKKDGEPRFCIDYRKLNQVTVKDRYPLPRIDDTIDAFRGAKYFTTLDLFSGNWKIEIDEQDKHKTAFVCEYGQYEFNRMPFGVTNAPSTFQRLMNWILNPVLYESVLVYHDDIIIFRKSVDELIEHIATVFKLLAENGLNPGGAGHPLDIHRISTHPIHVQSISTSIDYLMDIHWISIGRRMDVQRTSYGCNVWNYKKNLYSRA